jgi:hypothetical protein
VDSLPLQRNAGRVKALEFVGQTLAPSSGVLTNISVIRVGVAVTVEGGRQNLRAGDDVRTRFQNSCEKIKL